MHDESNPPPSARVRLEIAFLEDPAARPQDQIADSERAITVLVVAAEPDVRRYVGECLRARADLRVHEAATARAAAEFASVTPPVLVIVDRIDSLDGLSVRGAIVIVDDLPYGAVTQPRIRLLGRPFSADQLIAEVDQLLRREGKF